MLVLIHKIDFSYIFLKFYHVWFLCSLALLIKTLGVASLWCIIFDIILSQRMDSSHANQSSVCQVYTYMFDLL